MLLSDVAFDTFPSEFLNSTFPATGKGAKTMGMRYGPLDNVFLTDAGSALSIALAFILLYDSNEAAMADCLP